MTPPTQPTLTDAAVEEAIENLHHYHRSTLITGSVSAPRRDRIIAMLREGLEMKKQRDAALAARKPQPAATPARIEELRKVAMMVVDLGIPIRRSDAIDELCRLATPNVVLREAAQAVVEGFDCDDLTHGGRKCMDALIAALAADAASEPAAPDADDHCCYRCLGSAPRLRMILCPTCGNKRCPKASDHDLACTGSNEAGQPGSVYARHPDGEKEAAPHRDERSALERLREAVRGILSFGTMKSEKEEPSRGRVHLTIDGEAWWHFVRVACDLGWNKEIDRMRGEGEVADTADLVGKIEAKLMMIGDNGTEATCVDVDLAALRDAILLLARGVTR